MSNSTLVLKIDTILSSRKLYVFLSVPKVCVKLTNAYKKHPQHYSTLMWLNIVKCPIFVIFSLISEIKSFWIFNSIHYFWQSSIFEILIFIFIFWNVRQNIYIWNFRQNLIFWHKLYHGLTRMGYFLQLINQYYFRILAS